MSLKIAACEYPVHRPASLEAWSARLEDMCRQATDAGATLLVFPEYAGMELTGLLTDEICADLHASIAAIQPLRDAWLEVHTSLARRLNVSILAGSLPWAMPDATYRNRAWLCAPDGSLRFQDKIMMTRFETEQWHITSGGELHLLDAAGAEILLVPSCTDTEAGYHRVMLSARARALEQQCLVIQAPLSGTAPWSPAIDVNTGKAGCYAPVDRGFPDDGILSCGANTGPWLIRELPLARLSSVRRHGQVRNFHDWPKQEKAVFRSDPPHLNCAGNLD